MDQPRPAEWQLITGITILGVALIWAVHTAVTAPAWHLAGPSLAVVGGALFIATYARSLVNWLGARR